jgi:tRNA A58 N-methylase Trm61
VTTQTRWIVGAIVVGLALVAGGGRFSMALARRVGPEGKVYATELDPDKLEQIRKVVSAGGSRTSRWSKALSPQ